MPESQSIGSCMKLREECQKAIFDKMDEFHTAQMNAIGEINTKLAYREGVENGKKKDPPPPAPPTSGIDWGKLASKAALMWGPPVGFILMLGGIYWLKLNGYM